MKRTSFLSILLLMVSFTVTAQTYMNEWIDYSKRYYKFTIGSKGLYRITYEQLQSLGLNGTDASHFQIWRNGEEVPVYTTASSGLLNTGDFIEFWGTGNDGKWENRLYLKPEFQINNEVSLFTDTASYFLTVNPSGRAKSLVSTTNNLPSLLPVEPYFMHRALIANRSRINPGFAGVVGQFVYSSSFDEGEGFSSNEIRPGTNYTNATITNINLAPGGPDAQFRFTASGTALNTRSVRVFLNGTLITERDMNYFTSINDDNYVTVPLSVLQADTKLNFAVANASAQSTDRMVVGVLELQYPRLFNFGAQTNFEFELPATADGQHLVITNFNNGGVAPVIYDLTNRLRIVADISVAGQVRIVLPPSAQTRKLVLCSAATAAVRTITGFTPIDFVDYGISSNQGDYLIISNPLIYVDPNGVNQVEAYRNYRSSSTGGGYNAKVYDINQIIDQFGWGIKNNSISVKNFLSYARQNFQQKPRYCFILGKGVNYSDFRTNESWSNMNRLNFVPTHGFPASDNLLASEGVDVVPLTPIGRLNAVTATEVKEYLDKIIQYESLQRPNSSCVIDDELWKRNVIHVGGANDFLGEQIMYYLNQYKNRVQDTLFGATVYTLQKSSLASVQTISSETVNQAFKNGFSLLTYFGHSNANTLEFNLDNPENYPATGKFPIFFVNGCKAGDMFTSDSLRLKGSYTLTEKYLVSSPGKGAIAFVASTHWGIVNYLHVYTQEFYNQFTSDSYGKSLGEMLHNVADSLIKRWTSNDFFLRGQIEQMTLHGDPAISLYHFSKPDFAIEAPYVKVNPEFISIAEKSFRVKVKMMNIARAVNDSISIEVKREFPDGTQEVIYNDRIRGIQYADSLDIELNINPLRDKGVNKIHVVLDKENQVAEACETNNSVTKEFFIFEDNIRPTYPYNFSIIDNPSVKFFASTANPFGSNRKYYFEIDTTESFNSSSLLKDSVSSVGGSISFKPSTLSLTDNTVYYWRVGVVPENASEVLWNASSFIFRSGASEGFNQSHFFQFDKNEYADIELKPDTRGFEFKKVTRKLAIKSGLFPYFNHTKNYVFLDLQKVDDWRCVNNTISFYIFEPRTLNSWVNTKSGSNGLYGSITGNCPYPRRFFEYPMERSAFRESARLLLEQIPNGSIVVLLNQSMGKGVSWQAPNSAFIQQWMRDTSIYGSGNSLYHAMIKNGLTEINKFTENLPFAFVFEKGNPEFVYQFIGEKESDYIDVVVPVPGQLSEGTIETPWLGPSTNWSQFKWDGEFSNGQTPSDSIAFELYGKTPAGEELLLTTIHQAKDTSISFIDAKQYPYLKMKMFARDEQDLTPFQLHHWRLEGAFLPEGAIAPNLKFIFKDTVELGETLNMSIAFQNVSETAFDSLKLKLILTDQNNVPREVPLQRRKPLLAGDTLMVTCQIDTKDLPGLNSLYLMVNPDDDQPEQFLFNNFIFKSFYVKPDVYNPWLDVTFDGVHILNRDIVSSKPHILVKLKDENQHLALNDTTGMKVKIFYPDRTVRNYVLGSDSARFTPATLTNGDNTATIDLYPHLTQDGEYELTVSGNDRSGNKAGELGYKVAFQVINKPMISNLLNYPNPFTTSTAFVFTLTGSDVPQNMRIQILTITGKVVREITKNELGPIRIGRNITEYKWDGTDQFGNKLANGIYLYRVITNLNGQSLEKFDDKSGTDKYFKQGYGKMYLMR